MSRPLPVVRAGGWYHITNRGVETSVLLPTPEARDRLILALGAIAYDFALEVHAYCAMETHYHLLARGEERELRRALSRLETACSLTTEGARFRRMAIGRHLLQVTRYIHRNPVDAGLVRRPGEWAWSSYRGYLDPLDGPPWLRSHVVLGWLGSVGGRLRYRRFVEQPDGPAHDRAYRHPPHPLVPDH